jgi:hypothetical protein
MSLSDLASLGSFISALAVLVSLVFLYFQLGNLNRQVIQAEKNQRAALSQGYSSRTTENLRWSGQSPVHELLVRVDTGDTKFTAEELRRLSVALRLVVLNANDAFSQHQSGLLDTPTFDYAMTALKAWLVRPVYRALWLRSLVRFPLPAAFQAAVDEMIREAPLAKQPRDIVRDFEADLAKVVG